MAARSRAARNAAAGAAAALAAALCGPGAPPSQAGPAGPAATVVLLEGAPVHGPFASLGRDGIRLEGRTAPLPLDGTRELLFDGRGGTPPAEPAASPGTKPPPRVRLALRGGETLKGALVGGGTDWVEIEGADLPRVRVPFDAVLRVESESAYKTACDEPSRERPKRNGTDVAYAASGDAFAGTWVSAGSEGVVLQDAAGKRSTVSWSDMVVLQVDEQPLAPATGLVAEVETVGGSRIAASAVEGDATSLAVTSRSGLSLKVAVASVAAVRWTGGSFVYASDLPFTSTFTPSILDDPTNAAWYEAWWGARADRAQKGCPLTIAGTEYRHGIWVHAKSVVTIPLGKGYSRFTARFGLDDPRLDDAQGARGDATARVLVDGREAWTTGGPVKTGEAARAVGPLDVTGAQSLTLEVNFGTSLLTLARGDWVDPVLVRK